MTHPHAHDRETHAALLILAALRVFGPTLPVRDLRFIAGSALPPLREGERDEGWGHAWGQLRARRMFVENYDAADTVTLGETAAIIPRDEYAEREVRASRAKLVALGMVKP